MGKPKPTKCPQKSTLLTFFSSSKQYNLQNKKEFQQQKLKESVQICEKSSELNASEAEADSFLKNELQLAKEMLSVEKAKNEKTTKDLKHAKMLMVEASKLNLRKDLTIQKLMESRTCATEPTLSQNTADEESSLFSEFSAHFSATEIKILRSVNSGPSNDSNFVNKLLRFLYKDIDVLKCRSATGKKFKGVKKAAVTPEKKELIRIMLEQRIKAEECSKFHQRLGKIDVYIKNGIRNISKHFALKKRTASTATRSNQVSITKNPRVCSKLQSLIFVVIF